MNPIFSICVSTTNAQTLPPPVYAVLVTHVEDNIPVGALGRQQSNQNYLLYRGKLIAVADLCLRYNVRRSFQPDWKFLLAALLYEDSSLTAATNGKNLLRYLKEDLNVAIDPHSHEQQGYNHTDVVHLLDSLGAGGSTVIGGHIWDPHLPQFQQWDRFRVPVAGSRYSWAYWRGNILMGSGTPNHVNDPLISGVWRPKNRFNYFVDDPAANIASLGQYKGNVASVQELINLYASGAVSPQFMLTASIHIKPATIIAANGLGAIEHSLLVPLAALQNCGKVKLTDFTSLIGDWDTLFGSRAYLYPSNTVHVDDQAIILREMILYQNYPNPFNPSTEIQFSLPRAAIVRLTVYNLIGEEVKILFDGQRDTGSYSVNWDGTNQYAVKMASGIYIYRLEAKASGEQFTQIRRMLMLK